MYTAPPTEPTTWQRVTDYMQLYNLPPLITRSLAESRLVSLNGVAIIEHPAYAADLLPRIEKKISWALRQVGGECGTVEFIVRE